MQLRPFIRRFGTDTFRFSICFSLLQKGRNFAWRAECYKLAKYDDPAFEAPFRKERSI